MSPRQLSSLSLQHRKHNDPDYAEPDSGTPADLFQLEKMRRVG